MLSALREDTLKWRRSDGCRRRLSKNLCHAYFGRPAHQDKATWTVEFTTIGSELVAAKVNLSPSMERPQPNQSRSLRDLIWEGDTVPATARCLQGCKNLQTRRLGVLIPPHSPGARRMAWRPRMLQCEVGPCPYRATRANMAPEVDMGLTWIRRPCPPFLSPKDTLE